MLKLNGLATGIGSLPHKDPALALDLVLRFLPNIPFWPQLPKRDIREGMVAQFSENIPCLKISSQGLFFDGSNREKELEIFYEHIINNDADYFKISPEFASGLYEFSAGLRKKGLKDVNFIKCQITGPFTFAASIKDESGTALMHNPELLQAICQGLLMKAAWQVKTFSAFDKKIIVFIDEPYLGCFGSAYTPLNKEDVVKGLSELAVGIKKAGDTLVGVHCCGNTDWSIFTDVTSIDIINFDAFGFLDRFVLYADNLKGFLGRGGIICWGIAPTQDFSGKEAPDLLLGKLETGINALVKKGLERDLLLNSMLISPACGLGTLDVAKSEAILKLLSQLPALIKEKL